MNTKEMLKIIAMKHNTTPERVEKEIRIAIREAMKSKDPKAQMLWKRISPDGKEPSIERFLQCVVDMLEERRKERYKRS